MNEQGDLFDLPYRGEPPSQAHSLTSQLAAASIKPHLGPLHQKIIGFLRAHPEGATDEQLMLALDMGGNTERPRRRELQLMGRIIDSGRQSFTKSGRAAVVWRLP